MALFALVDVKEKKVAGFALMGEDMTGVEGLMGEVLKTRINLEAANRPATNTKEGKAQPKPPRAERNGPIAQAWALFSQLQGKSRKEVLDACVRAGLNINTATTQYQKWKKLANLDAKTPPATPQPQDNGRH